MTGTILIADDTPDNLTLLCSILDEAGYRSVPVPSGSLAIQAARKVLPDIILMDINMPEMDGYETTRRLKEDPELSKIPVIFVSSYSDMDIKVEAFTNGGVDFITRPFHAEEILTRVKTHITLNEKKKNIEGLLSDRTHELQESEKKYRQLIESVGSEYFFYTRSPAGKLLFVSKTIFTTLGYRSGELGDSFRNLLDVVHPQNQSFLDTLERDEVIPERKQELVFLHKHGESRIVEITEARFDNHSGSSTINGIAHDITRRKKAESLLQQARDDAENANRVKSDFLSRMSHELRTPLNAVMGFAGMINDPDTDLAKQRVKEYCGYILEAGEQLTNMVQDVLDLSRIESGVLQCSIEPVSPGVLIQRAIRLTQSSTLQKNISVHCPADLASLPVIKADPVRFLQIIQNFLTNAIRYNKPNGKVEIQTELLPHNKMRFRVADTGIGISDELKANLFQPFADAWVKRYSSTLGMGIGLSVCRELADLMDCELGFESEEDKGSVFWIDVSLDI